MFADGLHNTVDIRPITRNMSSRTEKDDIKVSPEPDMIGVPCRIIRDEKVLFETGVELRDGCELKDMDTGVVYEVRGGGKRIKGIGAVHHSSYKIQRKKASAWNGWGEDQT
jgi:hypothetical protein